MCDFILDCKTETALVSFLWVFLLFFFSKHKIMSFICLPGRQDLVY